MRGSLTQVSPASTVAHDSEKPNHGTSDNRMQELVLPE